MVEVSSWNCLKKHGPATGLSESQAGVRDVCIMPIPTLMLVLVSV